nr:MAG TPA: hypothetical protein [Caudoviricetes sp.]
MLGTLHNSVPVTSYVTVDLSTSRQERLTSKER